jgi:hypothetical protein
MLRKILIKNCCDRICSMSLIYYVTPSERSVKDVLKSSKIIKKNLAHRTVN